MRLENKYEPKAPIQVFYYRMLKYYGLCIFFGSLSLLAGMIGYHYFEKLDWIESFLNASMILSGMGPLLNPSSNGGKIFAGCYALYSGVFFIFTMGLLMTPIVHRILHHFHATHKIEK